MITTFYRGRVYAAVLFRPSMGLVRLFLASLAYPAICRSLWPCAAVYGPCAAFPGIAGISENRKRRDDATTAKQETTTMKTRRHHQTTPPPDRPATRPPGSKTRPAYPRARTSTRTPDARTRGRKFLRRPPPTGRTSHARSRKSQGDHAHTAGEIQRTFARTAGKPRARDHAHGRKTRAIARPEDEIRHRSPPGSAGGHPRQPPKPTRLPHQPLRRRPDSLFCY